MLDFKMNKKTLVNILYILSVVLLLVGIVLRVSKDGIDLFFWLGLFVYAIAEIIKSGIDKNTEEEKTT